ncbi:MAG TPA: TetR/AcrR family transcriptional regulator [Mycobacteriales bacterium]|nr:TetR/AcrR family transcriptional regulator [Mycobacteriales bacterium]
MSLVDNAASPAPALRADARRNRERIVEAARAVFAEQGLGASLNEVARRAGVGLATLLRRFPSRDQLVAAALGDRMGDFAGLVEQALEDPDPWHGFCGLVERVCAMQAGDLGFTEVLTQSFPGSGEFEELREQAYRRIVELFDRAKAAGRLRADFSPHDFPMVLMANAGVVTATAGLAPATSPRLIACLLQAFCSEATGPLPPPPSYEEMDQVLLRYDRP